MNAAAPSCLASDALARRLRELVGDERNVQVDFLLHLEEFDRRRAWAEAGYDSLWTYCQRALHLREGPAGRRIGAMRVLRRFPGLEPALRDGRLCLSTVTVLGPLLTPANVDGLVERAAYLTKAEVEHLAASLQPRTAPKDGVRKLPVRSVAANAPALTLAPPGRCERTAAPPTEPERTDRPPVEGTLPVMSGDQGDTISQMLDLDVPDARPEHRAELRPLSSDRWSLRVTLDAPAKADLDALPTLTSHSTAGDLAAVLREAVRCALVKHGKRKGAAAVTARAASRRNPDATSPAQAATPEQASVSPRPADDVPAPAARRGIPASVRREVWKRDGGCCAWVGPDGRRCGSGWKLQFDHILPVARGGDSTTDNLRLTCATHNRLHAEQDFGRDHMAKFGATVTHPGMSGQTGNEGAVAASELSRSSAARPSRST